MTDDTMTEAEAPSIIEVSREGARKLGAIAAELAEGEGLPAHARSAQYRLHG